MDQPSNLRLQLQAAIERADDELRKQGESCVQLKERLRGVVEAVEREDDKEAKRLMSAALDFEYKWLLDCEIGAPLSEHLGFDDEEEE